MRLSDLRTLAKFWFRRRFSGQGARKILDVGSGHHPHEDATHLVDRLTDNDSERGKPLKALGRPIIRGTVEALPFRDKSFDYVYACHVLEHTKDPGAACNELMRIARAGYIETPSPFYEQGYNYPRADRGWAFHRWFVWAQEDQTLVFEPKILETIDHFCECRYAAFIKKVYVTVKDLNSIHKVLPRDCNYTVLRWVDQFNFEVRGKVRWGAEE